jgi:hypothetical protein
MVAAGVDDSLPHASVMTASETPRDVESTAFMRITVE